MFGKKAIRLNIILLILLLSAVVLISIFIFTENSDDGDNQMNDIVSLNKGENTLKTHDKERTIVNISSFGAVPYDGIDDTEAFALAAEECARIGEKVTLVLPEGRYDLKNSIQILI